MVSSKADLRLIPHKESMRCEGFFPLPRSASWPLG